jgi:DeoR family fructose operon transcriptional repressor
MPTVRKKELAPGRIDRLQSVLRQARVAGIGELSQQLRVSPATIRRDLDQLERLGQIRRVHGGAVSVESRLEEPMFDDKASMAVREKHRIARAALEYIRPDERIFLDGGSTVLELARLIRDRTNLTVVTNSLRAAVELAGRGPRLILIGGELRRLSQTIVGPLSRLTMQEIFVDKAFMGTIGLSLKEGLTTTDPGEAFTKEFIMERAREVILLADSSKFGKVSFACAGRLNKIRALITDHVKDRKFAAQLRKLGIEIVQA